MRKLEVALVDDEREIADYLSNLIRMRFAELVHITTFYTGAKTLEYLKGGQCDLLISDVRMPVVDGFALLEFIIDNNLSTDIIFLTAYREFDTIYKMLKKKPITYLVKAEKEEVILDAVGEKIQQIIHRQMETEKHEEEAKLIEQMHVISFEVERVRTMKSDPAKDQEHQHSADMNEIKAYINNHIEGDISLSSLADRFHYHPNHLSRLFSREVGQTLSDYILESRVAAAKKYLADSELTVAEIARRLGYQSSQAFIRFFRREVGTSANAWRRIYSKRSG